MKKLVLSLLLLLHTCGAFASAIVSIRPVLSGSTLNVEIQIAGLTDNATPVLAAFDFDVEFDATQLHFERASLGNQLNATDIQNSLSGANLQTIGLLNVYELSLITSADLIADQTDQFTLANLQFSLLNIPSSDLSVTINVLSDVDGNELATSSPQRISQHLAPVPLPAGLWFMLSGLVCLCRRWAQTTNR